MSKRSKMDNTVKEFYKKEGKKLFNNLDDEYIQTRIVYEQYVSFCERNSLEQATIYKFTIDIKKLVPNLATERKSFSYYYMK